MMSIKPWNEKQLFDVPKIWDASTELIAAQKSKNLKLYETENERFFKSRPTHIKPIWIEGDKFAKKPTRHFAWVGLPEVKGNKKIPAVVLVHGGGGTAFLRWVAQWNRRGYAAIAIDSCGHLPVAKKYNQWVGHAFSPAWPHGDFDNADKPIKQQWGYHAITSAVRAHTYLRSLPEVNNRKIAITGVSWGGYLTSIVSSVDHRFCCAAPIYGCGFLDYDSPWLESLDKIGSKLAKRWLKLWDPKQYLPISKVPTLWTTGSNDFAYSLGMLQRSIDVCNSKAFASVHIRASHSHEAGWKLKESYSFIDSYCKGMPKLKAPNVKIKDRRIETAASEISKAVLCYTQDSQKLSERYWKQRTMKQNSAGRFAIDLPKDITGWFVNITDNNKNLTTSNIVLH